MATTDARIFRINDYVSAINAAQIAVEPANDADLGYRMYGGKDAAGNVQKWLAKDKPIRAESLGLIGTDTIGEAGLLRHDTNGDVVGKQMTVAELNSMLSDGPIGGTVNLPDGEIAYGGGVGGLESDSDFKWDDTNRNLLLNEPTITSAYTSLVINGSGSANVLDNVNTSIVTGDGNSVEDTIYSKVVGTGNDISGGGNFHDVSGYYNTVQGNANHQRIMGNSCLVSAPYSRAYGLDTTVTHTHAESRGIEASSVWHGANHFTGDRLNGEYSSQGMDGLILQVRTTDDTSSIMKFNASDSDSPLWCPDDCIQVYTVDLMIATDQSGAGAKEGFAWFRFPVVVMRAEPDFNAYLIQSELETIQMRGDGATLGTFAVQVNDTDNVVEFSVIGHATPFTTLNWIAHIHAGSQLHTDYYESGTGG